MAILGLNGPERLDNSTIDVKITRTSPGNYALGRVGEDKTFYVHYVGRADQDLNARLKRHAGERKYTSFKWDYASSPKAAFEKECHNFHDFGGSKNLDNKVHPDRPNGTNWKCPVCGWGE